MRVLVLTLSFGSGHVRAAQVIAREVTRQMPEAEVRIIDALENSRLLFRAAYVWPYWMMVRYAPALWGRFFAGRVARMDQNTAPEWAFRWGCAKVFEIIREFKPEVIMATEVGACELAALAKRSRLTDARVVNVVTDFEAEPVWVKPEVDGYAVADDDVRKALSSWGAPQDQMIVCGIPTDANFSARHDASAVRKKYDLRGDAPIVLLMGGGMGPTRMDAVAACLLKSGRPMQIVAVTGHDKRMLRRLNRFHPSPRTCLRSIGWTDDVAALMQTASVLITKPGGVTTAEAAVCGLSVVMFDPIPGPEETNAARLAATGAGIITTNARETAAAAIALLDDEKSRRQMSACAAQRARPEAAATIVRFALGRFHQNTMARSTTA